jgi:hypothetical protein
VITVTVEKRYGAARVKARVTAPTIGRAVEIAGPGARVEFPIDGETFFASGGCRPTASEGVDYASMSREDVETAYDAGLPGSYDAYLDMLKDDLGHEFEQNAIENCLI